MFRHLARLGNDLLDFVYPPQCLICTAFEHAPATVHLCTSCVDSLFAEKAVPPFQLAQRYEKPLIDICHAAWPFSENVQKLIHEMKYAGKPSLARLLAKGISQRIDRGQFCSADGCVIVPVPMHSRRKRERGYNQSEVLAKELARRWGLPVDARALRRRRDTVQQALLETATERRVNVQGAFLVKPARAFAGRSVLLIDDVVTTGSTASECAEALWHAGATRVCVLAVARP